MHNLRQLVGVSQLGVIGLAICLALGGCGQADQGSASLQVTSMPQAEVFVDGVSQGQSGATFSVSPGQHTVAIRLESFETYETKLDVGAGGASQIDAVLMPQDPSDPIVIAKLAECMELEVAPFVAPRTTRGGHARTSAATLLWPARDVRQDGLVNYAVEADEAYAGDGSLEFRHNNKVLYRESFKPESVTTVRSIPAEVLEHVQVGRTITWGLYFEDRRRPITTQFKIVQRPKADRQLEKLRNNRHMQRQPLITRQIMSAAILENNRLYTEALVTNLQIATEHPSSTQPYRGIVTTLRRLDGEDSELFAFVSPLVGGKGGHAGVARPGSAGRDGQGLGIGTWAPSQEAVVPSVSVAATSGADANAGPHGQGVTPTDQGTSADGATGSPATVEGPTTAAQGPAQGPLDGLSERSAEAAEASRMADARAADDRARAEEAVAAADSADQAAAEAEREAVAARETFERAQEPTAAQQEAMAAAGQAAEEAREAANSAREVAAVAQMEADRSGAASRQATRDVQALEAAAALAARSSQPVEPTQADRRSERREAVDPAAAAAAALAESEVRLTAAQTDVETATATLQAADAERQAHPGPAATEGYEQARLDLEQASERANQATLDLEVAREAVQRVSSQAAPVPVPARAKSPNKSGSQQGR